MKILMTILVVAGAISAIYLISALIAVGRSTHLRVGRKITQSIFACAVPIIGPMFVMHLLAEHEPTVIPANWTRNDKMNNLVFQVLSVHARIATNAARGVIEAEVISSAMMIEPGVEVADVD